MILFFLSGCSASCLARFTNAFKRRILLGKVRARRLLRRTHTLDGNRGVGDDERRVLDSAHAAVSATARTSAAAAKVARG